VLLVLRASEQKAMQHSESKLQSKKVLLVLRASEQKAMQHSESKLQQG